MSSALSLSLDACGRARISASARWHLTWRKVDTYLRAGDSDCRGLFWKLVVVDSDWDIEARARDWFAYACEKCGLRSSRSDVSGIWQLSWDTDIGHRSRSLDAFMNQACLAEGRRYWTRNPEDLYESVLLQASQVLSIFQYQLQISNKVRLCRLRLHLQHEVLKICC